jgi:hypothetical protein
MASENVSPSAGGKPVSIAGLGVEALHTVDLGIAVSAEIKHPHEIPVFIAPCYTEDLKKARAKIAHLKNLFKTALCKQYHAPPHHALNMVKVVFAILGYHADELGNPEAADPKKFSWLHARRHFGPGLVQELIAYDPATDDGVIDEELPENAQVEHLKLVMDTLLDKEVIEQGPAYRALLAWAKAAVAIKYTAVDQRSRYRILSAAKCL